MLVSYHNCHNKRPVSQPGVVTISLNLVGPGHAKTCLMSCAENKGIDQLVYPCSLISTFVVCRLDSVIPILAIDSS